MITLSVKDTGAVLGTIDEADLRLLIDQLEEETETDTDYFVSPVTIEMLQEAGARPELVEMLRRAVGDSEGVDIMWTEG
ncbi:MAG: galactosyldiacylglycerol synthase [Thermoleophilia bacterium]|nr:galactosyldiacylglycerol synthase [Thermoleophilia bacterium]